MALRKTSAKSSKLVGINADVIMEEAYFRSIFDALPDATVLVDPERKILFANPAVEKIFGYTAAEVIGRNTAKFYANPEDYDKVGKWLNPDAGGGQPHPYRVTYRRKDGSVFPSDTIAISVRNGAGDIIGYLGMMRDVTGKVHRERKIREEQLRYRIIADYTYDWEYWRDPDGSFRYVSPACRRITGYSPSEFLAKPSLVDDIIFPEDKDIWQNHYQESMTQKQQIEVQFRIIRKDGEVRWIEHACQPVIRSSGEVLGFRASNRDITERKAIENELRDALKSIESLTEQLEAETSYLQNEIELEHDYKNIIGNSNALQYVLFKVEQVAVATTTVLILGETGTGKELIARAIHSTSDRGRRALIKVNCAALPSELMENELFGHEKGAFTGAHVRHLGRFEVANGGSIFLDEVGELPLEMQAKLLRVLQDGEFERVGGRQTIKVDVRVIAATNRDLEEDVRKGRFRKDLWYRLNVFPITVPPLRERENDIPLLVNHFVTRFSHQMGRKITSIPKRVMEALQKYHWPGNIRELENVIERAVINSANSKLKLAEGLKAESGDLNNHFKTLAEFERDYIIQVLENTNWKVSGRNSAAEILDIDRSTLRARMKKLGIQKS